MTRPLRLFVLAGQSNMAGRGALDELPEDNIPNENIFVLSSEGDWKVAEHPLHYDKPALVGVGPGLSFAQRVLSSNNTQNSIGLIPCAVCSLFQNSLLDFWFCRWEVPPSVYGTLTQEIVFEQLSNEFSEH